MSKFYECHVGSPTCLTSQSLPQNQNVSKEKNIKWQKDNKIIIYLKMITKKLNKYIEKK